MDSRNQSFARGVAEVCVKCGSTSRIARKMAFDGDCRLPMNIAWLRYLTLSLLLWFGVQAGHAASPASPAATASAALTIEQVQARLTALATTRDLPESERTQAKDLYQQAISQLQAAKYFADNTATYQQLLQSASTEAARLQQALADKPPPAPSPSGRTRARRRPVRGVRRRWRAPARSAHHRCRT